MQKLLCELCNTEYDVLHTHLRCSHKITPEIYRETYPNAAMVSNEIRSKIGEKNAISNKNNPNHKGMLGKNHSKETKLKISNSRKGVSQPKTAIGLRKYFSDPENRKKVSEKQLELHKTQYNKFDNFKKAAEMRRNGELSPPALGYKHTKEFKEKRSQEHKQWIKNHPEFIEELRARNTGKGNPNWQGGLSFGLYGVEFTSHLKTKIRDKYMHKCQICSIDETNCKTKLDIHHIDYDKLNSNKNNLIALCKSCHQKTSTNRKWWTEFLQKQMEVYFE